MNDTERQLWDWLADCEARKPPVFREIELEPDDRVVRVLQYGVSEGREVDEGDESIVALIADCNKRLILQEERGGTT